MYSQLSNALSWFETNGSDKLTASNYTLATLVQSMGLNMDDDDDNSSSSNSTLRITY